MLIVMAILVGALYAGGFYLLMARSTLRLLFGLLFMSHAANLLIFVVGGLRRGEPPLVPAETTQLPPQAADPVPQALILTAIVISFAVLAFAAALIKRGYELAGTDDLNAMRTSEEK